MSFKMKTGRVKGYPSIEIEGNIIGEDAGKISAKINHFLKKSNCPLVINFSKTKLIDSHGLGALVYAWKQFNNKNQKLIFLCIGNFDTNLFSSANLDKIFTIVTSVEEL